MDKTFQKFLRSGIDLSPVGVERREDNNPYFCTPKGASIFGWAGVDGIHFCFIRGFGGMVFAVSPMNSAPDFVHPLSKDFADFLRLLLACGDVAALEQAWMWEEAQFEAFLRNNPPTQAQQVRLSEVAARLKLTPMEHPWVYLKELQASFDYGKIKYTEDYYDIDMNPAAEPTAPEWKVYFEGNFWGHSGRDRAGVEIKLNKHFDWAGHHWIIPAVYSCSKGLVVDFCMRAEAEDIRRFIAKWNLTAENDSAENFTQEQQMQMELENPLDLDFSAKIELNGKTLQSSHGCAVGIIPCLPDGVANEKVAQAAATHYGLDDSYGWMIYRESYLWGRKRRPEIKSLSITMEQQPCRVPGPHFKTHAPGDSFSFSHPVSGTEYTLTVQELEEQAISQQQFDSNRWCYPTHFTAMSYTISPEPDDDISICDCAEGDRPLEIAPCATAMRRRPETVLSVSVLSVARLAQPQLCSERTLKDIYTLSAPRCILNQWQKILNGALSFMSFNFQTKHSYSYNATYISPLVRSILTRGFFFRHRAYRCVVPPPAAAPATCGWCTRCHPAATASIPAAPAAGSCPRSIA